jgi:putative chitinase
VAQGVSGIVVDAHVLQRSLRSAGHPLTLDGVAGPLTLQALIADLGRDVPGLGAALARWFPAAAINTPLRIVHFIAQAACETGGFQRFTERGGRARFARHDGRIDLGNTEPGDGYRFRGRGIFQLTGRASYIVYGARLGLDLVGTPDLAGRPDVAVQIACHFWKRHGLNALADANDCEAITRKISGALRGLADRQALVAKIKQLWGAA